MKIKSCYYFEGYDNQKNYFIFPREYNIIIYYRENNKDGWVSDIYDWKRSSVHVKISYKNLPEHFKDALSDPLFEIQCLKQLENYENITEYGFRDSHFFNI